jgi:5-hydroxyisourate hydrolase
VSTLSTHVLDTAFGRPAAGIRVTLEQNGQQLGSGVTDADGRVKSFQKEALQAGAYQLRFAVAPYFGESRRESFYSEIVVSFQLQDGSAHYHVPLLLSPFGYTTYRGS